MKKENIEVQEVVPSEELTINLSRENGNLYLDFVVPEFLENIFKSKALDTRQSENWQGLTFYVVEQTQTPVYRDLLNWFGLFDNFGDDFLRKDGSDYDYSKFNIAFLRSVGGRGRIKINVDISISEAQRFVDSIIGFIKKYYNDFLKDYNVKCVVKLEAIK